MSQVKLFGTLFSPFVSRVQMALDLKGVEFEFIEEDLSNKSPLLLHYNPIHKKVPVLVHNGKAICESMVIIEYIDEVWVLEGPSILPKDPYDRAMSRFWANFVDEKCATTSWKACWSGGEEREKLKEEAQGAFEILEGEINGKKFFGGDNVGLVDFASNFVAFWLQILQQEAGLQILTKEKYPNLWEWSSEYCNQSFVKKYLPDREKTAFGFKMALANGRLY